jgi:TRAP-type C4-dicarboxylate transport system substrate-binding protein
MPFTGSICRRSILAGAAAALCTPRIGAESPVVLRLSTPATATDQRSRALAEIFAPMVAPFAQLEIHHNATLFRQGSEIEAIARGNLEMALPSAQDIAAFVPAFSVLTAGYLYRDAVHQRAVFASDLMDPLRERLAAAFGVRLIAVFYLGRRHLNLRTTAPVQVPADLAGVRLRMPAAAAWQFLGAALGALPVPLAFGEIYTALQTGAIDGQDNPLPTIRDSRFDEVTRQIVLTGHLVDMTYLAVSERVWQGLGPPERAALAVAAEAAADHARIAQLRLEDELADTFRAGGLAVYAPDVAAFRARVEAAYATAPFAGDWPPGMAERLRALGAEG